MSFFYAACVLSEEFHEVYDPIDWDIEITEQIQTHNSHMRMFLLEPARFCMAFSLELIAKAAIVQQTQGSDIENGKELPFEGHIVNMLCNNLQLSLSEKEQDYLKYADEIIKNGKYPTSKKPCKDVTLNFPNPDSFMKITQPIFLKVLKLFPNIQQQRFFQELEEKINGQRQEHNRPL